MKYLVILYPIYFLIFFFNQNKRTRTQLPNLALWGMFFCSSIASIYIVLTDEDYNNTFFGIIPIVYHCWMFGVILKTNERLTLLQNKPIEGTDANILRMITLMVIILGVPSFVYIANSINATSFAEDILAMRHELGEDKGDSGLMGYVTYFSKSYWVLSLALLFYYIIVSPHKIITIILLLISSMTRVVYGLSHAGRGDVVIYILLAGMLFLLLYKRMSHKSIKILKVLGYSIVGALLSVFLLISVVRFGVENSFHSGSETTTFEALIRYFGLGFANFSREFRAFWYGVDGGAAHFPILVGRATDALNQADRVNVDFGLNTFTTSIGSFVFDVGALFTVMLIYMLFYCAQKVSKRQFNIFTLFYAAWIYSYLVESIFYFSDIFTGTRVLSLLFIFFLDMLNNSLVKKTKL